VGGIGVNRLFRWGILIALVVLIGSGMMAIRLIFVEDKDVAVPSLVGLSYVEASNMLQGVGLQARIDQIDSDQPQGIVISQSVPTGDSVGKGNIITLRVSRGGTLIQIPDVRGMEFAEAVKMLDATGLKLGTVLRVPDQLKPAGTVIAQNPASPAGVLNSRMIELLVSEGKTGRPETVQVPDLRGQEESLARQIAEQSDLSISRVIYVESNLVPVGTVVRTQPKAGSRVQSGASVILQIERSSAGTAAGETLDSLEADAPSGVQIPQEVSPPQPRPVQPVQPVPPVLPVDQIVTTPQQPSTVPVIPAGPTPQQPPAAPVPVAPTAPVAHKTAKIRYQVPPLSRSLSLKIEISDENGQRVLREQQANGGEYIAIEAPYNGNANVSVQLGGELVWQERYD
jgi:serine/threonine-protein kinase